MKIFVTGATGFVGTAVVKELLAAGHQVVGLARSDEAAKSLEASGASVHRGSLDDLESLKAGAAASDGVIHLAFNHDFSNFVGNCIADKAAIEAMGEALKGSTRPLVVTSGTSVIQKGGAVLTESEVPDAVAAAVMPRCMSEFAALSLAQQGVHASIVRLPLVHGKGDHDFIVGFIGIAAEKGITGYLGDGINVYAAVHNLDAARVYRLAVEKGEAGGIYHAVGDEALSYKEIAGVIGKRLSVPVESVPADHFGWMGMFAGMCNPASSIETREKLGWTSTELGLIADLESEGCFQSPVAK